MSTMTNDDTQLVSVDCPHEGCGNRRRTLIPDGTSVTDASVDGEDRPDATGKVRVDCDDHLFYVHFTE